MSLLCTPVRWIRVKTGFPFPEREFAVEKHFFKTGLTFLSVLTNISFLNIAFGTVYWAVQVALQRQPVCKGGGDLELSCKMICICSRGVEVEGSKK